MQKDNTYDVIIIGGGPAGLSASIYTSRARLKTLLLESVSLSNQASLTDKIENYPGFPGGISGIDLIERMKRQSKLYETEFIYNEVKDITKETQDNTSIYKVAAKEGEVYGALSVIIASGARPKKLGIPGEDKFIGRGISYCATCDAAFFKDKDIVVIGGGDAAAEEALFLTKFAKTIKLIHRRNRLRAVKILQERIAANKKIETIWSSKPVAFLGEKKLKAVKIEDVNSGKMTDIICEGAFIFIGYIPNTDFVRNNLRLDEGSYIITDNNLETSQKGIFACGDCRQRPLLQIVTACGEGAIAAYLAGKYIDRLKGTSY